MINKDYLWAGVATIAAMILFPCYFVYAAAIWDSPSEEFARQQMLLTFSDWVFLGLGALLIYIYMSLKRILNDHHNFHGIDVLLYLTMILIAFFHGGMFLMDAAATVMWDRLGPSGIDTMVLVTTAMFVGSMLIFGIIDVLIGIILIRNRTLFPGSIKAFAILTLVMSFFELTIVLSFMTILIYPAVLLTIAVKFLQQPRTIEVV